MSDQLDLFGKPRPATPGPEVPPRPAGGGGGGHADELDAALHEEARRRYLNYAISVITSRALPDVRDGLKPVQRRILYAMYHDEHLTPDAKYRKCATVVGSVLGKYHPHGDTAVYDALVRMAQPFSLRLPLVDGNGNFGSLDGDSAAAYRYTECRLGPAALDLLEELKRKTVDERANFDGTTTEPVIVPARFPNLLVNGATGIAVGMATNIPPHNLGEMVAACVALIDNPELDTKGLLRHIKGPDFPTGGQMLNTRAELLDIYETGQGAIRVRGEYTLEEGRRGQKSIVVTSIPYALSKATLVESIAALVRDRRLVHLVDVRDESTADVRIVLELRRDADPALVMAYLYRHTPLQQSFHVNLTCLVPTDNPEVGAPHRLSLKQALGHFLAFRELVTRRRFEHELAELRRRIHILEALAKIFHDLDEAIRIIRRSDGKADAAARLAKRFELDDEQTEAILELKLYKLAKLEISAILAELALRQKEARRIEIILKDKKKLWEVIRSELADVGERLADKRRTRVGGVGEEPEYSADAYIVAEDAHVILTRDGWLKRVRELKDPNQTRVREGDEVLDVLSGSTKENLVLFSNYGTAYVARIHDIPPSTGYGDPVQKLFKFRDGERVIAALSLDPRKATPPLLLAVTRRGFGLRFALEGHREVSTRAGRRFARVGEYDEIVGVLPVREGSWVAVATERTHRLVCPAAEVNLLANPGKGVTVIKVEEGDRVIGFEVNRPLQLELSTGKPALVGPDTLETTTRGCKGRELGRRVTCKVVPYPVQITSFTPPEVN